MTDTPKPPIQMLTEAYQANGAKKINPNEYTPSKNVQDVIDQLRTEQLTHKHFTRFGFYGWDSMKTRKNSRQRVRRIPSSQKTKAIGSCS